MIWFQRREMRIKQGAQSGAAVEGLSSGIWKMNRSELANELNVSPWDIDDWLLWGCPAEKFLSQWNFNLQAVSRWLKENKIKIKKPVQPLPNETKPDDDGWLNKRCPKCREKGFPGEQAGLLCTYGEIVMGRWRFRRVGYPCGHSMEILP